jgi:phosphomannomutase
MPRDTGITSNIITSSGIAFGTSGARGLVEQFTDDVCAAFTTAFLAEMKKHFQFERLAIGIDRRPSSPDMAAACAGAAKALCLGVDYYGVLPTPAIALQAMTDGIPAIVITGSHIPFDRNGIKFYRPDGEISKSDEHAILNNQSPLPNYQPALPEISSRAKDLYVARYTALYPNTALSGLRIGLYEHSAAGRDINREIFEQLGATVISLGRTDNFVPIDTEAVSEEDRARGREWAKEHKLDAIFSTDGDGDRPLLADEQGNWLRGDILGLLCARNLGVEALASPVSCNTAIELSDDFNAVSRTRIGSPFVIEAMGKLATTHKTVAGFEANGGFLTATDIKISDSTIKALPTRDAVLPALVVLTAAASINKPLSALISVLPERYTASDRIANFPTEQSNELIARWKRKPEALVTELGLSDKILTIDFTDGLRATLQNGHIVHLRPSGNAPELRCYCEAETPELVDRILAHCLQQLIKRVS